MSHASAITGPNARHDARSPVALKGPPRPPRSHLQRAAYNPQSAVHAFTLIEVLIAAVVLTAGLAIALQSIASGLSGSTRTARQAAATALAADRLAVAAAEDVVTTAGSEIRGAMTYRWEVRTTPQGDGVDELTCTVEWRDARGGGQVTLSRRAWTGGGP
ncbi:MAG: prepilin-type N-terminal cleavage/methylation domain-containing protein [Planctomycetota bacterium]